MSSPHPQTDTPPAAHPAATAPSPSEVTAAPTPGGTNPAAPLPAPPGILYCNCTYAQIIDPAVKAAVLRRLCDSGRSFEAVADLCEMSARRDPALQRLARAPGVKIAACYPRAVKWLFTSAGAPLDLAHTEVINMRELAEPAAGERLFAADLQPNLPPDKTPPSATSAEARSS